MALQLTMVALGGAFGSVCRYLMHAGVQKWIGTRFPWGTLSVNVLGCLLVGFLAVSLGRHLPVRDEIRLGILVGVLGGFTTFSTFGFDTYQLVATGDARLAVANVLASCAIGLTAVWIGVRLAERCFAGG
ncbi:MAG: fluoride efflux transporter CrcB [Pirellulales bacterium]|nr:fluoride efflux transporter CrcB [Pirellulales bacterium]